MSKFKTDVVYKVTQEAKGKDLELGYLYFKNVPVTFAQALKPGKKYNSEDTTYSLNLFINSDTKDKVEKIGLNKELAEVGVTKVKKGKNRGNIKYPLDEHNTPYGGMFAAQFTRDTVKRNADGEIIKTRTPLKVVDSQGNPFTEEVGNGSVCHIKLFTYRNQDEMLVVMLDTVVVLEHIPYVREESFYDEELGITVQPSESTQDSTGSSIDPELSGENVSKGPSKQDPSDDFDGDSVPF